MVLNLLHDSVGIVVFGNDSALAEGDTVQRTTRLMSVKINENILGRSLMLRTKHWCKADGFDFKEQMVNKY